MRKASGRASQFRRSEAVVLDRARIMREPLEVRNQQQSPTNPHTRQENSSVALCGVIPGLKRPHSPRRRSQTARPLAGMR
jgi:hypothetical protein